MIKRCCSVSGISDGLFTYLRLVFHTAAATNIDFSAYLNTKCAIHCILVDLSRNVTLQLTKCVVVMINMLLYPF